MTEMLWVELLIFATTSLLVLSMAMFTYDYFFRYGEIVKQRLESLEHKAGEENDVSLFKDFKRLESEVTLRDQSWGERLQLLTEQAGVHCSLQMFYVLSTATGLIVALAGLWHAWWLAALLGPFGVAAPYVALQFLKRTRQRKLCRQLPEAFSMISRAVRAGQTVPSALHIIAEDFEPPIATEFALCYEQQNLGVSRESTLRKLAARSGVMELQIFVVALLVQARSGGDLVELLDNLAGMVRKRLKLKDRVRALTGEGRMQAVVLILLPLVALFGTMILSPEYAKYLLERPWLLACTATAQAVGSLWIRKIINFEY